MHMMMTVSLPAPAPAAHAHAALADHDALTCSQCPRTLAPRRRYHGARYGLPGWLCGSCRERAVRARNAVNEGRPVGVAGWAGKARTTPKSPAVKPTNPVAPCCRCGTSAGLPVVNGRPVRKNVGVFGVRIDSETPLACMSCYQWYRRRWQAAQEGRVVRDRRPGVDSCEYLPSPEVIAREAEACRLGSVVDVQAARNRVVWEKQQRLVERAAQERREARAGRCPAWMGGVAGRVVTR